ncbi:MAG: amidohydrolase family protein, partial [Chloroflexota bacterium]|nr:amidohydrolase family protein [Chloroflexota bacterium]
GKGNVELSKMYEFIKLFPENKIILSHWGGGLFFYELMKEVKELSQNVYYDTAATSYLYNKDIFDISIKIIGAEKILFGSDFPILNPSRVLSEIKNIGADNIQKLTSSNAEFLLGY